MKVSDWDYSKSFHCCRDVNPGRDGSERFDACLLKSEWVQREESPEVQLIVTPTSDNKKEPHGSW